MVLNFLSSSSTSANYSGFSDKLLKPSSITETSKSCSGIELARGISVVFAEKNSHLMLPHRDVSLQFTEVLRFGKSYSSSMASKDSSTDADSQESTPRAMKIPPSDLRKSKRTQMRSVIIPYALDEIWSSEEYTCVVVHGDDHKPAVTHIFCDYILEYCHPKWMVGRKIIPTKNPVFPPTVHQYSSDNDNNLCSTCNQRLKKEEDIYMFQFVPNLHF